MHYNTQFTGRSVAKKATGLHNLRLLSRSPNRFGCHAHNVSNSLRNPVDINPLGLQAIFPLECLLGLREHLLHKFTIAKDTLIPLLECASLPQCFHGGPPANTPNQSPAREILPLAGDYPLFYKFQLPPPRNRHLVAK